MQRPKILRPFGKIYQAINAETLRAQNIETWPYFNQVILYIDFDRHYFVFTSKHTALVIFVIFMVFIS